MLESEKFLGCEALDVEEKCPEGQIRATNSPILTTEDVTSIIFFILRQEYVAPTKVTHATCSALTEVAVSGRSSKRPV